MISSECPEALHGDEAIARYRRRISGPLVDRIDIHLGVPAATWEELAGADAEEASAAVRRRVEAARARQVARAGMLNSHLGARQVRRTCRLSAAGSGLLEGAMQRLGLSARAYARILKLARTIADLEGAAEIEVPHLGEAIQYRSLDRRRCPAPT